MAKHRPIAMLYRVMSASAQVEHFTRKADACKAAREVAAYDGCPTNVERIEFFRDRAGLRDLADGRGYVIASETVYTVNPA